MKNIITNPTPVTTIGDVIDVTIIRTALRQDNCRLYTKKHKGTTGPKANAVKPVNSQATTEAEKPQAKPAAAGQVSLLGELGKMIQAARLKEEQAWSDWKRSINNGALLRRLSGSLRWQAAEYLRSNGEPVDPQANLLVYKAAKLERMELQQQLKATAKQASVTPGQLRDDAEWLRRRAASLLCTVARKERTSAEKVSDFRTWRDKDGAKALKQAKEALEVLTQAYRLAISAKGGAANRLKMAIKAGKTDAIAEAQRLLDDASAKLDDLKQRKAAATVQLAAIEDGIQADKEAFAGQEATKMEAVAELRAKAEAMIAESDALDAHASEMVLVRTVSASGKYAARWCANEVEARAYANASVKAGLDAKDTVMVDLADSYGRRIGAATTAKPTAKLTASAAWCTAVETSIANKKRSRLQNKEEIRTLVGAVPAWEVAVIDLKDDGMVYHAESFGEEAAAEAESQYEKFSKWIPVVLLKDGHVYQTNIPAADGKRHELAYVRKFKVTPNGLEQLDTIRKLVSPTMLKISSLTGNPVGQDVFLLEAKIDGLDSEDEAIKASAEAAQHVLDHAVDGLTVDGQRFRPYGHGTNKAKDGILTFCPASIVARVRKYQNAGASNGWLVSPAKFCGYGGLTDVAIHEFVDVLGVNVTPGDAMLIETLFETVSDPNGIVEFQEDGSEKWLSSMVQKCSDGSGVLSITEEWLAARVPNEDERQAVRERYEAMAAGSFRMPMMKGFLTIMPIGGLHTFAKMLGIDLDPMKVLFVDNTVFKGLSEGGNSHDSLEDLEKGFQKYGCVSGMLLSAHKPSDQEPGILSTQAWRGMVGVKRTTMRDLWDDEVARIKAISAGQIVGGTLGRMIDEMDGWDGIPAVRRYVASQKRRLFVESSHGRFHGLVYNLAGNGDIFRWFASNFGKEFLAIPAYTVVCRGMVLDHEGQEVVIGRSPCFGLCVVKCYSSFTALYKALGWDEKMGAFLDSITKEDGTLFFSSKDDVVTRLQGDYDGDHYFMITNARFVEAVKEAQSVNRMPYFCSVGKKGGKFIITDEVLNQYFKSLSRTPSVGKWDNGFAKLIGSLPFDHVFTEEEILSLGQAMDRFQNDVDAGKHGDDGFSEFKLQPSLARAMSSKTPLARGLWLMKTEREPGRSHGLCAEKFCLGMWDVIREVADREIVKFNKELAAAESSGTKVDVERLVVPGSSEQIDLFNFVGKAHFRFFPEMADGTLGLEPLDVIVYDDELGLKTSVIRQRFFCKPGQGRNGHDRVSEYAGLRQPDGSIPVYYIHDDKFEEIKGSWICNESKTPYLFAQEGRIRNELRWMQGNPDALARYGWLRNDAIKACRIGVAAYAALYGHDMINAAQKAFDYAFRANSTCNMFQLRHVANVFAQEAKLALAFRRAQNGLDPDPTNYRYVDAA